MARAGMGEPFIVTKPGDAEAKATDLRKMVSSPVLTDIKLDFGGLDVYDVEPASVPDVFSERPVIVFGKWHGKAHGTIVLSGVSGEGAYSHRINVVKVDSLAQNSALRYLWARHRIATLGDDNLLRANDERIERITRLGLEYNLLTAYTSFVAIDSEIRNKGGKSTTVRQPLPLPEGVSDLAVGGASPMASGNLGVQFCAKSVGVAKRCEALKEAADTSTYSPNSPALPPAAPSKQLEEKKKGQAGIIYSDLSIQGALTEKEFQKWFNFNRAVLEGAVGSGSSFSATLKIKVDAKGYVKSVEITSLDKGADESAKRLVHALKSLNFPVPTDGRVYEIDVTLFAK
jgi:Ca-activated chloride channel homolog